MESDLPIVNLSLWRADAIVLFDWLNNTDLNTVPITHPARKQALADVLSGFDWAADVDITGSTASSTDDTSGFSAVVEVEYDPATGEPVRAEPASPLYRHEET
ncbi:hypothetical protein [Streptosporangium roseum]|uniref:hypothetical protein n=1 Tax=Streptosporangium roseum TaxID=2001 RepID=UPI00332A3FFF